MAVVLCNQSVLVVQAWRDDLNAQERLRECIKTAIRYMFIEEYEVPVLAMFFKEHLGELLSLRRDCEPGLLPVRPINIITRSSHCQHHHTSTLLYVHIITRSLLCPCIMHAALFESLYSHSLLPIWFQYGWCKSS